MSEKRERFASNAGIVVPLYLSELLAVDEAQRGRRGGVVRALRNRALINETIHVPLLLSSLEFDLLERQAERLGFTTVEGLVESWLSQPGQPLTRTAAAIVRRVRQAAIELGRMPVEASGLFGQVVTEGRARVSL